MQQYARTLVSVLMMMTSIFHLMKKDKEDRQGNKDQNRGKICMKEDKKKRNRQRSGSVASVTALERYTIRPSTLFAGFYFQSHLQPVVDLSISRGILKQIQMRGNH